MPVQLLIFATACVTVLFLSCAFPQLVQTAQFATVTIKTDGTKALNQIQHTRNKIVSSSFNLSIHKKQIASKLLGFIVSH